MPASDTEAGNAASGEWCAIARIARPRGRRGELIAEVLTDFPDRFKDLKRAFIEAPPGPPRPIDIADVWWHGKSLVIRFEEVQSIDQASQFRDRLLLVRSDERVKLGAGRYYVSELAGCEVIQGNRSVGRVIGIEPTSGADLLVLEGAASKDGKPVEILIPFAQEICTSIDVEKRRIVIDPPEGLLELNDEGSANPET